MAGSELGSGSVSLICKTTLHLYKMDYIHYIYQQVVF